MNLDERNTGVNEPRLDPYPYYVGYSGTYTPLTVEQAEAALKNAKEHERQQRKSAKRAAKAAAQQKADKNAGLRALREIAANDRKYSADARVIAAQALAQVSIP